VPPSRGSASLPPTGVAEWPAERQAVEPQPAQQDDLLSRGDARIDLYGPLGVGADIEMALHHAVEPGDLLVRQVGRRSAAPVILDDGASPAERRGGHRYLALEVLQVGRGHVALLRGDDGAAAVGAARLAERHVYVERKRLVAARRRRLEPAAIVLRREPRVEFNRGRIGGVARPRPVVALDQRGDVRDVEKSAGHAGRYHKGRARRVIRPNPEGKRRVGWPAVVRRWPAAGNPAARRPLLPGFRQLRGIWPES
jgi:hypothetical protein